MSTLPHSQLLRFRGRLGKRRLRVVLALASLAVVLAAGRPPASAQQPPPSIRFTTVASTDFMDSPCQYDLMQTLLELAPGAAIPSHRVNGRSILTVLTGEVTRVEENGETAVYRAGETFAEGSGDHFDVDVNRAAEPARLLATFLLQPGAEPLIPNPNAPPSEAPGPVFVAVARATVGPIPAQSTLTHGIFEVSPGFRVGVHTHDGWSMVTELSGGHVTNRVNGQVQDGATFVHGPPDVHEGEHTGSGTVTAMFASVGPTGAPPSRPVTTDATQTQARRPPATGGEALGLDPDKE